MDSNGLVSYRQQANASGKVSMDAIDPTLKSELHNSEVILSPYALI